MTTLTLEQKLKAHMERRPIYPLYGETSIDEHIAWGKAFDAWDGEKTRLEMLVMQAGPNPNSVIWDGAIRHPGKYNDNLHRPRGNAAPQRASWARITPKDDVHARKLERQREYRRKQKEKKAA